MRPFTVTLALAVLAAQSGCGQGVPAWRLPEPPDERLRRGLGRVAVVVETHALPRLASPPLAGACTMAAVGALTGMGIGLAIGVPIMAAAGHCTAGDPLTLFLATCILGLGLAVSLAGAALGALIGAIDGSSKGRSAEEVEAGRRILDVASGKANLPAILQSRLLEELRRETRLAIVEPGQADILLVIEAPRVFLAGPRNSDPPLTAAGEVSFRLRRPSAKESLHHILLGFRGATKTFSEWTAADGEEYRLELLRGVSGFPSRVVEEFFLLERGSP